MQTITLSHQLKYLGACKFHFQTCVFFLLGTQASQPMYGMRELTPIETSEEHNGKAVNDGQIV